MSRNGLIKFKIPRFLILTEQFVFTSIFLHEAGLGRRMSLKKKVVLNYLKTHFKEGDINEGLINKVVQLSGKYCSWLDNLKDWDGRIFLDFMKGPLLQLNTEEYIIKLKLSVLKCLRDGLETDTFWIRFVDKLCLLFQVFNATDNLKGTRATHWFLGLNDNFTEINSGNKSLSWHVFWENILPPTFFLMLVWGLTITWVGFLGVCFEVKWGQGG